MVAKTATHPGPCDQYAQQKHKRQEEIHLNMTTFVKVLIPYLILETVLLIAGCPFKICLRNAATVILTLFIFSGVTYQAYTIAIGVYLFVAIEFICYFYYKIPPDVNLLGAIEVQGFKDNFLREGILFLVGVLGLCFYLWFPLQSRLLRVPFPIYATLFFAASALITISLAKHYFTTFPLSFENMEYTDFPDLERYLTSPTSIAENGNGKNLVIIQVESLENEFIGSYSKMCPGNMEFMTKLTKKGFFNDNVIQQKYIDYSAGALFGAECGMPLLRANNRNFKSGSPAFSKSIHCVGDFLNHSGYHMEAHVGFLRHSLHHYGKILTDRGYSIQGYKSDAPMVENVTNVVIPALAQRDDPWVLFVTTQNTHLMSVVLDGVSRLPKCPPVYQAFDIDDMYIERIYNTLISTGAINNTEIIIYGDHRHMQSPASWYNTPRRAGIWIPTQSADRLVPKQLSTYDIPWTIMDLMGISPSPPWPWGKSMFSEENGTYPHLSELSALHKYWNQEIGLDFQLKTSLKFFDKWTPAKQTDPTIKL